jgi:hypothetical protein
MRSYKFLDGILCIEQTMQQGGYGQAGYGQGTYDRSQYQQYYPAYYTYKTYANTRQYQESVVSGDNPAHPTASSSGSKGDKKKQMAVAAVIVVALVAAAVLFNMGEPKIDPTLTDKVSTDPDSSYVIGVYVTEGAPEDIQGYFNTKGAKYIGSKSNASIVLAEVPGRDIEVLGSEDWVTRIVSQE